MPVCGFNFFRHYYGRDKAMDNWSGTMIGVENCKMNKTKNGGTHKAKENGDIEG